ncbi:hypothetical protein, partial [Pantoea septica]|uniref:hypothetical protein n=1 Tax=Pantoea septica TaxID=472695 RepID=UPI0028A7314D
PPAIRKAGKHHVETENPASPPGFYLVCSGFRDQNCSQPPCEPDAATGVGASTRERGALTAGLRSTPYGAVLNTATVCSSCLA